MKDPIATLITTFAALSLVAIGGQNAVLPELHRQVVTVRGWMDDGTFSSLFALAQAAPGPNVLIVSLIGWHQAGVAGMGAATLAMITPSSVLSFGVGRLVRRLAEAPWLRAVRSALAPIAVGLMLASGVVTARAADHGVRDVALTASATAWVLLSRRNPLWALAIGAVAGLF